MPLSRETIERRAVKKGVKASKKRHHLLTREELLSLRVQVMPTLPRIILVILGLGLLAAAWLAWPSASDAIRGVEAITGIFALLFGTFGIRRTLSHVLDSHNSLDLAGAILELIGEAVSGIDL